MQAGATSLRRHPADEVDRLATTMNGMLARLERAAERERRLVADTSHELRNPRPAAPRRATPGSHERPVGSPTRVASGRASSEGGRGR